LRDLRHLRVVRGAGGVGAGADDLGVLGGRQPPLVVRLVVWLVGWLVFGVGVRGVVRGVGEAEEQRSLVLIARRAAHGVRPVGHRIVLVQRPQVRQEVTAHLVPAVVFGVQRQPVHVLRIFRVADPRVKALQLLHAAVLGNGDAQLANFSHIVLLLVVAVVVSRLPGCLLRH
jgi:hypothetical protein